MTTLAIVPLRSLRDGKRRLSDVLSPATRTLVVQRLFRRTLAALHDSQAVAEIAVVSPDPALLDWVAAFGVVPIHQPDAGLNHGLEYARRWLLDANRSDVTGTLVVLPDLPFVQPGDLAGIVRAGASDTMVIAADRHARGTNALWSPSGAPLLPYCFGADSFRRHTIAAREQELAVRRYDAPTLAFDLDTAADLRQLAAQQAELLCSEYGGDYGAYDDRLLG